MSLEEILQEIELDVSEALGLYYADNLQDLDAITKDKLEKIIKKLKEGKLAPTELTEEQKRGEFVIGSTIKNPDLARRELQENIDKRLQTLIGEIEKKYDFLIKKASHKKDYEQVERLRKDKLEVIEEARKSSDIVKYALKIETGKKVVEIDNPLTIIYLYELDVLNHPTYKKMMDYFVQKEREGYDRIVIKLRFDYMQQMNMLSDISDEVIKTLYKLIGAIVYKVMVGRFPSTFQKIRPYFEDIVQDVIMRVVENSKVLLEQLIISGKLDLEDMDFSKQEKIRELKRFIFITTTNEIDKYIGLYDLRELKIDATLLRENQSVCQKRQGNKVKEENYIEREYEVITNVTPERAVYYLNMIEDLRENIIKGEIPKEWLKLSDKEYQEILDYFYDYIQAVREQRKKIQELPVVPIKAKKT
jgi:hypothetical protein